MAQSRPGAPSAFRFSLGYLALFMVYGVTSPYLQILIRGLGYGPALVGLILGVYELAGIAGPILIGRISDRLPGSRLPLLASAGLAACALYLLVRWPSPAVSLPAIALLAIGFKTLMPLMDAGALRTVDALKAAGKTGIEFGTIRSLGSASFIAVALAFQAIPGFDLSPPSRIAACIAGLTAVYCLALFAAPSRTKLEKERLSRRESARSFDPVFFLGLGVIALGRFAMAPVASFISLYAVEGLGWHAVGGLWAISALAEIPVMLVAARVVGRYGPMPCIAASTAAVGARLLVYAAFPTLLGLVAGQLLHSLCYGLFMPAAAAFMVRRVPPERRSEGMAAMVGLGIGLPTFLGSALGGLVVEAWGYRVLFASFSLFAAAALALHALARGKLER